MLKVDFNNPVTWSLINLYSSLQLNT
jgi:hypothetical protein